ncbi:hypothetical protein [Actinomadura flavalba]|uniref:hypothetical protein n=1 Tax=Actinomadura flavalba TaxID=1120938 RepID=UPI0012DDAA38|nr:hypothetical protein [Actinomadura flavalba]
MQNDYCAITVAYEDWCRATAQELPGPSSQESNTPPSMGGRRVATERCHHPLYLTNAQPQPGRSAERSTPADTQRVDRLGWLGRSPATRAEDLAPAEEVGERGQHAVIQRRFAFGRSSSIQISDGKHL